MLTFRCEVGSWEKPPALDEFEALVTRALSDYHKESRDYIPKLGVASYSKKQTGWPHIHNCLQRHNRTDESPVVDPDALEACAREYRLTVTVSRHDPTSTTELRDYVARHLLRYGTQVIVGDGLRTKFAPRIEPGPVLDSFVEQPEAADDSGTSLKSCRASVQPLFRSPDRYGRQSQARAIVAKRSADTEPRRRPERETFEGVLLQSAERKTRRFRKHGIRFASKITQYAFDCPNGESVRWKSWNTLPVVGPDGARYPLHTGLRWNFEALGKLGDGDAVRSISRVKNRSSGRLQKICLLDQPKQTRLAYAEKYGISRCLLGLSPTRRRPALYRQLSLAPTRPRTFFPELHTLISDGVCDIRAPPRLGRVYCAVDGHRTPQHTIVEDEGSATRGWSRVKARIRSPQR